MEWAILDEWCGATRALFTATGSSATVWQWGPDNNPALQFTIIPPRDSELTAFERAEQLRTLREGLALFAAVAWIDANALVSLLQSHEVCTVKRERRRHAFMMAELPVFVEIRVTRKLSNDPSRDFAWVEDDLVSLCCQLDEQNTSEAFQDTWAKVQEISRTQSQPLRGIAIPIRIIIGKPEYSKGRSTASQRVWDVITNALNPDQVQWGWFTPIPSSGSTLAKRPGSAYYASYLINSVSATNTRTTRTVSTTAFMDLVTEMSRGVYLSALSFCLLPLQDSQIACRMISALFCEKTCVDDHRGAFVNFGAVSYRKESGVEMNALCSALALTRSCRSFAFNLFSHDSPSTVEVWQWMAYAFFSNRARSRSSVKQVTIYNARLNRVILDTISRILTAANAEKELFAVATGLESTSNAASDTHEYHLKQNAVVQVTEQTDGRVVSWKSADIFRQGEVGGVAMVNPNDGGSSEWVDVLVPGIGFCKVQRSNLVLCGHNRISKLRNDLELDIQLSDNARLTDLLRLVGGNLCSLWLDFLERDQPVAVAGILKTCPHLQELTLRNSIIVADAFVRACKQYNPPLRRLECNFDDIRAVAEALSDESSVLTSTLRWWHCNLERMSQYDDYRRACGALTRMLSENKVLRYLTVVANSYNFHLSTLQAGLMPFHLQELEGNGELEVACKLAFLSVFHADEARSPLKKQARDQPERLRLHAPDTHVITKIFEFAVKHAVRKVDVIARNAIE